MTLTRNAAATLNRHKIRVNQINVGWTLTEGEERVKREEEHDPDWLPKAMATRPFGRLLSPHDIALAAEYFASDASALVTGTVMDLEQFPIGAPSTCSPWRRGSASFPKCYFDELVDGRMPYEGWIRDAATLGAEGVEHYDGFFRSVAPKDVDPIVRPCDETGQETSMLCFSPDFTHPDAEERRRQVDRQKAAIDLTVRLGARFSARSAGSDNRAHPAGGD